MSISSYTYIGEFYRHFSDFNECTLLLLAVVARRCCTLIVYCTNNYFVNIIIITATSHYMHIAT